MTDICKKMFQVVCKRFSRFLASYHEHRLHWFTLNSSILDETVHKLGLETVSIKYTIYSESKLVFNRIIICSISVET